MKLLIPNFLYFKSNIFTFPSLHPAAKYYEFDVNFIEFIGIIF